MLNAKQLQTLRELLSYNAESGGKGALCGKGYREMAEDLGKRFGVPVTEGSVRHYVRTLRREQSLHLVPPRLGWPKGQKRDQVRGKKPLPWAFLYREVLALTGWSASQLHAELKLSGFGLLPARRTLLEQIERTGKLEARPPSRRYGRVRLTDLCTVRLHQLALTRVPGKNYWVVMAGYEVHTGFLNVALLDLTVRDEQPKRRGRPKVMSIDKPVGVVVQRDGGDFVRLQEDLWWRFCTETVNRLGLPVTHFEYVSDFGLTPMLLQHQNAPCYLENACMAGTEMSSHDISEDVFTKFVASLTSSVRHHNERRKDAIHQLRDKAVTRLKEARQGKRPGVMIGEPPFEAVERYALLDYYNDMDDIKQLDIGRLAYRPERAWVTLQRHGESAFGGGV